jgi:glycosyltransferase involved in cell wall biosynthesis
VLRGGELVHWLKDRGIKVFELPELVRPVSPRHDFRALLKLREIMKEEAYDLVHCHSSKAGIVGRLAARWAGVPRIIFTAHGWGVNDRQPFLMRLFFGLAERLAGWVSTDVVCVSKADWQLGKKFVAPGKLKLIYNGVEEPRGSRGRLRQELGIGEKDLVIAMAARLKEPKDPMLFLRTAERLPDTHFVLVGDGPLRPDCERFIGEKGLRHRVHLTGTREDLMDLYPDFDIFVLFSAWEGLPLTICEAMRAGLPVVASRVGGVAEQVTHGWNGFLVEKNDPGTALSYLEKIIKNQNLRRTFGANSKKRGEDLFCLPRMVEEYEKLYRGE